MKRTFIEETAALCAILVCTAQPSDFPLYWTGPAGEVFAGPAGDVNGDGVSDVILVSTPTPSVAAPQQALIRSGLNGSLLHTWVPSVLGGWAFGVSTLEPAGDLNFDGFGDVVLATNTTSGAPSSVLEVRSGLDGSVMAIIPPLAISNGTWLATNTAGVGDLDGDGLPELLAMGNHQVFVPGCMSYGQGVYNLEAPGFGLQYYQTSWQCAQGLGTQLGRLDDVDGDGGADFYVGAWRTDVAGVGLDAGWIGVFSGATGSPIASLGGSAPGQYLGASVAALGDVTGDGMPEVAALRSTFNYVGYEVSVLSLPSLTTIYSVTAGSIGAFGIAEVDRLGDSDGDGLGDFLVRWASPQGFEAVTAISGSTGAAIGQVAQGYAGGVLYLSGGLGDVNGDGLGDFATTPWTQLTTLPPIAGQGLWSPWSWPLTDGAVRVYASPNLRMVGAPAVGGTAQFQVVAPKHAGRPFQVVIAQDYAFPALPLGPFLFPLAPDALLWASLAAGIGGTLNANGQGTVAIPIPNNAALHGAWFSGSGFVYDPAGPLGIGCVLTQAGFQIP